MPSPSTIHALCASAPCAQSDAEILLAHITSKDRSFIIAYPEHIPTPTQRSTFSDLCARRAHGEPLAYLTGNKEFYGRGFDVTPDTLIPRPETEILIDRALKIAGQHIQKSLAQTADSASTAKQSFTKKTPPLIIADIGTGSGAIIVTLAAELAATHADHSCGFIATDTSINALTVANTNARTFVVDDQIAFIQADLLTPFLQSEPLTRMLRLGAHLLVCANLPYVDSAQRDHLLAQPESCALAFEPGDALWADDDGLALYERFLAQLANIKKAAPKATITTLCEIDPSQEHSFIDRAHKHFPHARTTNTTNTTEKISGITTTAHPDLSGRTRIIELNP